MRDFPINENIIKVFDSGSIQFSVVCTGLGPTNLSNYSPDISSQEFVYPRQVSYGLNLRTEMRIDMDASDPVQ